MKVLVLSLLMVTGAMAVTKEVVRVFQPVSYHDTDSASEFGVKGELVQAAVTERAIVLSGAFPEDLAKSVAMPYRLPSNNPTYGVEEANLLVLCGIKLEATRAGEHLVVEVDCTEFAIPELVELTARQILTMTVESIRRTVRVYYQSDMHEAFECEIRLVALNEATKSLADLSEKFQVGK